MRRLGAFGLSILLAGCASSLASQPLLPNASVPLSGRWDVTSVNGRSVPRNDRYWIDLKPEYAVARFGCNQGSGRYRLQQGWLIPTGDWIITVAGCSGDDWKRFERVGFEIMTRPLAVESSSGGVRLRSELGRIDIAR